MKTKPVEQVAEGSRSHGRRRGDLNRKSQHKMMTHDGMCGGMNPKFKKILDCGVVRV